MKICSKCNSQVDDNAVFCNNCGSSFQGQPTQNAQNTQYNQMPNQNPIPPVGTPIVDQFDHTSEFSAQDVSDNKIYALMLYAMGIIGVIVALLAKQANNSDYLKFHLKQAIKIAVIEAVIGVCAVILCWTFIVPFAAGIAAIIIFVVKVISFVNTCSNKSVEPVIIRNLGFLN